MDVIQKKLTALDIIFWMRENYKMGKSGSTSKNAVYQHYLDMCKEKGIEPSISATYFGKLVKRAFPDVKYNRKGPRGGTKQHYTHLKRIDPAKKSMERQLQQVPTELQQEYNYYHSINLEKEKEEMGGRMFGMFKMEREGTYVPSLSAMYASALEVEREEEMTRHRPTPAPELPPRPPTRSAYGHSHEDDVDFLACLKPLAHPTIHQHQHHHHHNHQHPSTSSPTPSRASPPLPSSSSSSSAGTPFFPRLLNGPPDPTSPSTTAYATQAGGYPPPYYSGMAPPMPPNLTSTLPFPDRDRDHDRGPTASHAWPSSSPSPAQRALPPPLSGGGGGSSSGMSSPYHHPLHYLATTTPTAPGGSALLPTSSSPSSSPRGSYSQHHLLPQHHHQQHHPADIPFASLPPLLAPPLPSFSSTSHTLPSAPHLYRSAPTLSNVDERREQTAQQREDSKYSPPPLRHAP